MYEGIKNLDKAWEMRDVEVVLNCDAGAEVKDWGFGIRAQVVGVSKLETR